MPIAIRGGGSRLLLGIFWGTPHCHRVQIQNQTDVNPDFGTREANYLGCVSQSSHQRRIFHNYLNHTPGLPELRSLLYTSSKHVQMYGLS